MEYLRACWLLLITSGVLWLLSRVLWAGARPSIAGVACRLALAAVVVTQVLAAARSLNGPALVTCGALLVLLLRCRSLRAEPIHARTLVIRAVRACEEGNVLGCSIARVTEAGAQRWQRWKNRAASCTPADLTLLVVLSAMITLAALLRFGPALGQVRFGHPHAYQLLLDTRQLILTGPTSVIAAPLVNVTAALAVLAGVDPIHGVRVIGALTGLLITLAAAAYLHAVTRNLSAAACCLGALGLHTFTLLTVVEPGWLRAVTSALDASQTRQWNAGEPEFAALFVLCTLASVVGGQRFDRVGALCGSVLVALTSPIFLLVIAAGAVALQWSRVFSLTAVCAAWLALAADGVSSGNSAHVALITLPIALALAAGVIIHVLGYCAPWRVRGPMGIGLLVAFLVCVADLAALAPRGDYVEYEIAARKTADITRSFPRGRWLIISPVEQLPAVYGVGWHVDLAEFVTRNGDSRPSDDVSFDFAVDDVFIFVEKRPFVANVPVVTGFHALTDSTYMNYRSAAGRASLEYEAARICERARPTGYMQSIYYEDDVLKIYRYSRASTQDAS